MRILFIGDIVGSLGRKAVGKILPELKKQLEINAVFANGENLAHGRGATKATVDEVFGYGVDYFTGGNHLFFQPSITQDLIDGVIPVLRPENYPTKIPGKGHATIDFGKNGKVLLVNLQGRAFLNSAVDDPFRALDRLLEENEGKVRTVIVDLHAEATSEKVAAGFYFDGRVSALIGTHTHVPTADNRVLSGGTAFVSDVGMVGARESVLGVKKEIIIEHLSSPLPSRFEWVEDGPAVFQSVLIEVDELTGKAINITRVDRVLD